VYGQQDPRLKEMEASWFAGRRLLDIGCHEGIITLALVSRFHPSSALGVDIDPKLIGQATLYTHVLYALRFAWRVALFPIEAYFSVAVNAERAGKNKTGALRSVKGRLLSCGDRGDGRQCTLPQTSHPLRVRLSMPAFIVITMHECVKCGRLCVCVCVCVFACMPPRSCVCLKGKRRVKRLCVCACVSVC
jgi:hypothetical protein